MRMRGVGIVGMAVLAVSVTSAAEVGRVRSPREVLGREIGSDRVLASYGEVQAYLRTLADESPRVRRLDLGPTVEGRQMIAVAISTPANLTRLGELRERWARIADPRHERPDEVVELVATTPACVVVTAGIHPTEVAGPQSMLLFAHELAAAPSGSSAAAWLEDTVVVLVPSLNPDGHEMVVDWYRRYLGTPYEGSNPPFLYHRYAGHDNNRDFVYLNLPESRALNRFLFLDWHPQAHLDLHQMGLQGPRQFVPPFADPIAPLVHPLVWRMTSLLGGLMALRLEEDGRAGVVSGWEFDGAWIGGTRNTGWWKNVFGILTETAGAALATPVHLDDNELRAGGKGLADYRPQLDFPNPWRGGRWGLPEAVAYQRVVLRAFVEFAATWRTSLLRGTSSMAAEAVRRGTQEAPWGWLVPPSPTDPGRARHLVGLLQQAGVEVEVARSPLTADGRTFPTGTVVLPAAQPFRQFLLEVLEPQPYPEVRLTAASEPLPPYDVTAWSLPLFLGVEVVRVDTRLDGAFARLTSEAFPSSGPPAKARRIMVPASQVAAFAAANRALAAGLEVLRVGGATTGEPAAFAIAGEPEVVARVVREAGVEAQVGRPVPSAGQRLHRARVGVLHPDLGLEDAGWCRLVLERAGFEVEVVDRRRLAAAEGMAALDVLVLPAMDKRILTEGRARWQPVVAPPPEYVGGVGTAGGEAVKALLARGGTVVGVGGSAEWLIETLELPVGVPTRALARSELACPGSLLRVEVDARSPLGWGLPSSLAVLIDEPLGFETRPTGPGLRREVGARFPDGPLLVAGWMRGEERLRRRAAAVTLSWRSGRVVLLAFSPHFRAQTQAAFPLLFNAIGMEMGDPVAGEPAG
ncbi:MAG: hypothetical protein KA072_01800 [Thermoanaerobaculaceae bacterium]|nr:hypothetical protein [Thermoanaerobaculaceae bacterium]MDI9622089.1 M14 family zinc carboxypeptidase [Acidobacteriota bacterium]NLH11566.1 hypothetical protein [Holophagae bacterium]HPW54568.1 M14 family zinc carboxypeptidase [Thermoanaerobaculaceae bacterium]